MQTQETFYRPGLESPDDIAAKLPPIPRIVRPHGVRTAIILRVLLYLSAAAAGIMLEWGLWQTFIDRADVWAWTLGIALIPVIIFFLPWALISTFQKNMNAFRRHRAVYENGVPAQGSINTVSKISGREQECHYVEHKWTPAISKVRIDYTFDADGNIKTGTVIMHESSAKYLLPNSPVCVLYLKDDPARSMIFPMPGPNWFL